MVRNYVTVVLALSLAIAPISASVESPAIGRTIDNWANHNLPFVEIEYSSTHQSEQQDWMSGEYSWRYNYVQPQTTWWYTFEFYDEMDAEEKIAADSNHQMETLLGQFGDQLLSAAAGAAAGALGGAAAKALNGAAATTRATGATSGVSGFFGGWAASLTGWGNAAGSY